MSRQDIYRIGRNRIRITPGSQLLPSAVDAVGSTVNIIVNGASAMAEECESRSAGRFAAVFAATARDDDLDRWVLERSFGRLPRKGASAAAFNVLVSRTGTASGSVPAGTEMSAGGLVWTLDNTILFAAAQLGPLPASFTCSTLGSAGNLGPADVAGFKTVGVLFDPTLTIAPTSLLDSGYATGGADRESDVDYRARFAAFDAGLDRNTGFLAAGGKTVPGILYAETIEDIDSGGEPVGTATLYLGDINGRANAALLARVRAALRGFRLAGQRVVLRGTAPDLQELVLSFAVIDGFEIAQVQEQARAAAVAYVNGLGPGASLQRAGIATAIKGVPGVSFLDAYPFGVVTPAADVAAASTATIFRTRTDLVGFS